MNKLCWFTTADCLGQIPCSINKSTGSTPKLLHWCALIFLPLHSSQLALSPLPVNMQAQVSTSNSASSFPFIMFLPPRPSKAFFFSPSPYKHTNENGSIWRMVFVAEVVTRSVGVLMVVTNLKGRIQVTRHLLEVLFFSKPWLFNISKKRFTR